MGIWDKNDIKVNLVSTTSSNTVQLITGQVRSFAADGSSEESRVEVHGKATYYASGSGFTPDSAFPAVKGSTFYNEGNDEVYINVDGDRKWRKFSG